MIPFSRLEKDYLLEESLQFSILHLLSPIIKNDIENEKKRLPFKRDKENKLYLYFFSLKIFILLFLIFLQLNHFLKKFLDNFIKEILFIINFFYIIENFKSPIERKKSL